MFFWSFMHRIQSLATSSDINGWLAGTKQCWNAFISVLVIRKPLSNVHWEFRNPRSQSGSVASRSFPCLISSSLYLSLTLLLCFTANASSPTPLPECLASFLVHFHRPWFADVYLAADKSIVLQSAALCRAPRRSTKVWIRGGRRVKGDIPAIWTEWKPTYPAKASAEPWKWQFLSSWPFRWEMHTAPDSSQERLHNCCALHSDNTVVVVRRNEKKTAFMDCTVCWKWSIGLSFKFPVIQARTQPSDNLPVQRRRGVYFIALRVRARACVFMCPCLHAIWPYVVFPGPWRGSLYVSLSCAEQKSSKQNIN